MCSPPHPLLACSVHNKDVYDVDDAHDAHDAYVYINDVYIVMFVCLCVTYICDVHDMMYVVCPGHVDMSPLSMGSIRSERTPFSATPYITNHRLISTPHRR